MGEKESKVVVELPGSTRPNAGLTKGPLCLRLGARLGGTWKIAAPPMRGIWGEWRRRPAIEPTSNRE